MSIRIDGTNTTANPGITGSDTDTGLQFGTNEVKIVTDGEERVKVDSGGRVLFEKAVRFQYNTDSTDSRTWMLSNDVHGYGDFAFRRSDAQTSTSFDTKILFKDSGGICFNGDTAATNALDDYEEGDWTPVVRDSDGTGTWSYTVAQSHYTKVGRLVTLGCHITSIGYTGTPAGYIQITGAPFPKRASSQFNGACVVERIQFSTDGFVTAEFITGGATSVLYLKRSIHNSFGADVTPGIINNGNTGIRFTITYEV